MNDWEIRREQDRNYWLHAQGLQPVPVIVGEAGLIAADDKREGDMATPIGCWALRHLYYRNDVIGNINCVLPSSEITKHCGWCDDPHHHKYNRHVTLPLSGSHEKLWRDDGAYDLIIVLGYNDKPVLIGKGSAIFLHCIAEGKTTTAGCVAMARQNLLSLLQYSSINQHLCIIG